MYSLTGLRGCERPCKEVKGFPVLNISIIKYWYIIYYILICFIIYYQILIHFMYVLIHVNMYVHIFFIKWHTLVLCWSRLPVEILPLMSLNELSTDPSTDLRFLYLYPLCIYVFFVYIWISVFVHWRICVSVFSIICDITHYVYVVS